MKLSTSRLKEIIREEIRESILESAPAWAPWMDDPSQSGISELDAIAKKAAADDVYAAELLKRLLTMADHEYLEAPEIQVLLKAMAAKTGPYAPSASAGPQIRFEENIERIIREEIAAAGLNEGLPMPRDVGLGAGPTGLTGLGLSRVDHPRFRASRFGVAKFTGHEKPKTYNREKRTHDILAAIDEDGALWFKVARAPGDLDEPEAELKKLGYRYSLDVPVPS